MKTDPHRWPSHLYTPLVVQYDSIRWEPDNTESAISYIWQAGLCNSVQNRELLEPVSSTLHGSTPLHYNSKKPQNTAVSICTYTTRFGIRTQRWQHSNYNYTGTTLILHFHNSLNPSLSLCVPQLWFAYLFGGVVSIKVALQLFIVFVKRKSHMPATDVSE